MPKFTWDEKVQIALSYQQQDTPLIRDMQEVRARVNGDYVLPLVGVDGEPAIPSPSPQLIENTISHNAMRAASTRPVISVPALDHTKPNGVRSMEYANVRRKTYYGVWHHSGLRLLMRRAYRHLSGYGEMVLWVSPGLNEGIPRIELRDPLVTYPEPRAPEDVHNVSHVAFIHPRSVAWLMSNFGSHEAVQAMVRSGNHTGPGAKDELYDVLEFVDGDEIAFGILGPRHDQRRRGGERAGTHAVHLKTWPNLAGRCPASVGRRVTLDRIASQVASSIGAADLMDRLMALEVIAQERAVFPDKYMIGQEGRVPQILNGRWQDGREGQINLLDGVQQVGELRSDPPQSTSRMIERLDRSVRVSAGNPELFAGVANSSIRSGATVNALGSFAVDPQIQELQDIGAYHLTHINSIVHDTLKGYYSGEKKVFFSGWASARGHVELDVDAHLESPDNVTEYPFAGADANALTVAVGQLVGTRLMSRESGRRLHPMIENDALEHESVLAEAMEEAVLQSFLVQIQDGSLALIDAARTLQLVEEGKPLTEAILQASREAQERQAEMAPPPGEGQITSPEAQAGLAAPGVAGVEQPVEPGGFGEPAPGVTDLQRLSAALSLPVAGMIQTNQEV